MNQSCRISYAEQIEAVNGSIETLKYTVAALDGSPEGLKMIGEMNRMIAVRETLKQLSSSEYRPGQRELPVVQTPKLDIDRVADIQNTIEQAAIVMYGGLSSIAAHPDIPGSGIGMKAIAVSTLKNARTIAASILPSPDQNHVEVI